MAGNSEVMLALGAIVFLGFGASLVFERFRIPDLVLLLLAGILIGPVTGLVSPDAFSGVAPGFATLALAVILFEGGLDLDARVVRRQLGRSFVLLLLSYALTAAALAAVGHFLLALPWTSAALLGLVAAPLSSSILIPLLGRLRVKERTRTILTIESALGDVLAVVATALLVESLAAGPAATTSRVVDLVTKVAVGSALAAAAGVGWLALLRWLRGRPYAYMVTFAAALLLYGLVETWGGSGVAAVLVFALVLGNAHHVTARLPGFASANLDDRIRWFHAEMSFLVRTFFFVYLGTALVFDNLGVAFVVGVLASLGVILLVRVAVVGAIVAADAAERADAAYLSFLVPRGLASAALAGSPAVVAAAGPGLREQVGGLVLVTNLAMTAFLLLREGGGRADPEATGPEDWAAVRKLEATTEVPDSPGS